jgi:Ca2+-transporting ATPase
MEMKKEIWQKSRVELFRDLGSAEDGLTAAQAAERLEQYGPNELREEGRKSVFRIFLEQYADFLVIILILAAAVSAVLGMRRAPSSFGCHHQNAILGTVQTVKATASLDSLRQMSAPTAKVLRDGHLIQIPGRDVVPGDVVALEAGDAVCADGRLLECASLKCAESALTGESLPVEKELGEIAGEVPLGARKNRVFSGSFVTYGRGRFLVTGTGMDTEMGKIAALLKSTEEKKTPLQVSLDQFGRKLSIGILIICAVIFAVSVFLRQEDVVNAFVFAVALAVAAIPEALSSIVTIVLSFGTQKMARENAIIRKLQAVEGLGSVSVICSDKTGTLTQNKMTVKALYTGGKIIRAEEADFRDPVQEPLRGRRCCAATPPWMSTARWVTPPRRPWCAWARTTASTSWPPAAMWPPDHGDPLRLRPEDDVHGPPALRGPSDGHQGCRGRAAGPCVISDEERVQVEAANERFSSQGLRVLAFACRTVEQRRRHLADEDHLSFLGLIAMMDPPGRSPRAAVSECIAAVSGPS